MPQKSFYLCDDNYNRLKELDNASKLIDGLLTQHFETQEDPIKKAKELETKMLAIIKEKEANKYRIERVKKQKYENMNKQLKSKEIDDVEKAKISEDIQRDALMRYDIPKHDFNKMFKYYMDLKENGRYKNIIEFTKANNIKKREKRKVIVEFDD